MSDPKLHSGAESGDAPRDLVAALRRLDESAGPLPEHVDRIAIGAALRTFEGRDRTRRLRRVAGAAASAAALGLAVWSVWPHLRSGVAPALPGDVDGSGAVDMLDALIVANGVRDGAVALSWDMDGDGAVTWADVDLVAIRAVHLGAGAVAP